MDKGDVETRDTLGRVNQVCKIISILVKVALVILCIYWVFSTGLMVYSLITGDASNEPGALNILRVILNLGYIVVIVCLFAVINRIFSDTAKGESPFTMVQVKRLRLISMLLVIYAILDISIVANDAFIQYQGMNVGFISTYGTAIIPINISPLIVAAVVFAFSFVFKYGVLLQEFSDDAL